MNLLAFRNFFMKTKTAISLLAVSVIGLPYATRADLFRMKALLLILCCAGLLAEHTIWAADSWIWWEGENPSSSNIPATTWLSPSSQSERDALSGGNIRTAVSIKTTGPYFANYTVNVAQAGTNRFYVRKIWQYGPFKWRFDSAAWSFASSQLQLIDSTDYKQYFPLNWVYLGDVTLAAGAHMFRLEMNVADWSNEPDNIRNADFGGFDAFILSTQPFIPRGKLKPGQKYNLAEPGKWNFEAPAVHRKRCLAHSPWHSIGWN